MKLKNGLFLLTALLSTQVFAEDIKIEKTKDAIEFAEYIDTRPSNVVLFETTTREINYDKKEAYIMGVAKMKPQLEFHGKHYGNLNKPFILDYSNINVEDEINIKTYPQERIEDECNLTIVEYGLFVEGKFEGDRLIATNLKRKELDRITNRYCYTESSDNTFQKID